MRRKDNLLPKMINGLKLEESGMVRIGLNRRETLDIVMGNIFLRNHLENETSE